MMRTARHTLAPPSSLRRRQWWLSLAMLAAAAVVAFAGGCAGESRPAREQADLLRLRAETEDKGAADGRAVLARVTERSKAQYDDHAAGRRPEPPVVDILVISGGGDWGAFGAGFLKGWGRVPKSDALARPEFEIVTGVSTGALIAPFAFLGDEASIDSIENLYRNPQPDWVKKRGLLYFLPNNISLAEVPGLERELSSHMTPQMVRRIADAGAGGRALLVNTTNVDDGGPRVFDLVAEARRATETGKLDRIYDVMLASAGIPGVFPFRVIDGQMYVDGGATGNIIYGGRISDDDSLWAAWQRKYPDLPIPKTRYWVLFNNQVRPTPQVTEPRWLSVITRSLETSTRAATVTGMRHLFATAEIARLKRKAEVEVRVVSIPGDWRPSNGGAFLKGTMNELADLGERMGADPASWRDTPP